MARVTVQDALDYCLGNQDSLSVEQQLAKFPEYRDELQPLLALSANISTLEPPPVPLERRMAMKQRLLEAASAPTTSAAVPQRPVAGVPSPRPWWENLAALLRRPAFTGALGAVVVVALLWWSSAGSLPDSPLYGIKLTTEDLLRNFTSGTSSRIESYLNSAGARLADIREMQRRDNLSQANPAIDNYKSSIVNSASLWEQTSGDERTNIAKKLYVSSAQGVLGFGAVKPDLSNVADEVRANISETIQTLEELRADTGGILVSSNVDVNALLLEADIEPSTVPTPLPRIASGTATAGAPAVAASTQTSIAIKATETSITSAAQLTAVVILGQSGQPSGRISAAQTVVAGGSGSGMVSARQTVLAPVTVIATTSTTVTRPTSTLAVPRTATPIPSPRPSFTTHPPTARPPTNTPRPPQATPTRRATNTRIVQVPTSLPVVLTAVSASPHVPTTRPASTVTSRPTTPRPPAPPATLVPTNSPIILSTLVPLPTVTIELPLPPTQVPNTPGPTNTPVLPLPTIVPFTPPVLLTITLFPPSPTQQATPTSPPNTPTPLPLPTEIECALELEGVALSCGSGLCLDASGIVHNESASAVTANWTAELRVRVGTLYITLSTQTGSEEFAPGDTTLEPTFCVPLPIGTNLIQVRLSLAYTGCSDQQSSGAIQPCDLP